MVLSLLASPSMTNRKARSLPPCGRIPMCFPGNNLISPVFCNAPDSTFHIHNSDPFLFWRCPLPFPEMRYEIPFVVGFLSLFCILFMSCISYHVIMCIAFAYVFVSCIRAFSPLSVLQSDTPMCTGAPLLSVFMSGC